MEISKPLWWGLLVTIFLALVIMVAAYFWSRHRAQKIKDEYWKKQTVDQNSAALIRDNAGQMLWDEKEKVENPLSDVALEFCINTMVRNGYKTFKTVSTSQYETLSLTKLANAKEVKKDFTFLLSMETKDPIKVFEDEFKNINTGGMIIFTKMPKRSKRTKDMIYHFKINNITWDHEKYGEGLIMVVK